MSGYKPCACRDCFEIAIGEDGEAALCNECEEAGCDCEGGSECSVEPDFDEVEDRAVEWVNVNHPDLEGAAFDAKVREARADLEEIDAWRDSEVPA